MVRGERKRGTSASDHQVWEQVVPTSVSGPPAGRCWLRMFLLIRSRCSQDQFDLSCRPVGAAVCRVVIHFLSTLFRWAEHRECCLCRPLVDGVGEDKFKEQSGIICCLCVWFRWFLTTTSRLYLIILNFSYYSWDFLYAETDAGCNYLCWGYLM